MRRCSKKIPTTGCAQRWCVLREGHGGDCSPIYPDEPIEPVLLPPVRVARGTWLGARRPR